MQAHKRYLRGADAQIALYVDRRIADWYTRTSAMMLAKAGIPGYPKGNRVWLIREALLQFMLEVERQRDAEGGEIGWVPMHLPAPRGAQGEEGRKSHVQRKEWRAYVDRVVRDGRDDVGRVEFHQVCGRGVRAYRDGAPHPAPDALPALAGGRGR